MSLPRLNLREREVLDAVHRLGRASADDVRAVMPEPPSNSAVRTHLRILEGKGHVRHEKEGRKFLYVPAAEPEAEGRSALLNETAAELSTEHLDQLDALIRQTRESR